MSRDQIDTAIEELKSFQPKPAFNALDRLRNKTDDFIQRPLSPSADIEDLIREAKELIEEWEYVYSGWSEAAGRTPAADERQAIVAKLEGARALAPAQQKNRGGRPPTFRDAFWIEMVRYALMDATGNVLPPRPEMLKIMRDWTEVNFPDADPNKSPSRDAQIRELLSKLYATPGIIP